MSASTTAVKCEDDQLFSGALSLPARVPFSVFFKRVGIADINEDAFASGPLKSGDLKAGLLSSRTAERATQFYRYGPILFSAVVG